MKALPAIRAAPGGHGLLLCFCAFLLVVLNVVVDPRAIDISLMPRLLALQVFLVFCVAYVAWSGLGGRIDFTVLRDPLIVCSGVYALATVGSLAFAVNPTAGFTDAAKTFSVFFVLVLACLLLPLRVDWPAFFMKFATVAGGVGVATGLLDWPWSQGWLLHSRSAMETVEGLMSNVNLYASFLLLVLPLTTAAGFVLRGWWRTAAVAVTICLLILILLLQTRAVYLGLSTAALVAAWLLVRTRSWLVGSHSSLRDLVFAVVLFVMAASAFLWLAPREVPAMQRLHGLWEEPRLTAAGGRPVIWLASLAMFRDHPGQGVGAGNFPVRLHDYFAVDDPEFSTVHPNWLQSHNDFLWVLAEKGLFGFIFYLGLFVLAFRHLRASLLRGAPRDRLSLSIFLVAGLTGYLVVSFFDFPLERISHQVYLAVYLAAAVLLGREASGPGRGNGKAPSPRLVRGIAAGAVMILLLGAAYALAALRQERLVRLAREAYGREDWPATVFYAQRAATPWKTLDPFAVPVSYLEGMGHLMMARQQEALDCFERARHEMPRRSYILHSLGLVHQLRGDYDTSINCYEEVLRRSPGHAGVLYDLARTHLLARDPQQALERLRQIPADKQDERYRAVKARAEKMLPAGS